MVDLMLQQFGEVAFVSGPKFELLACEILIADGDLRWRSTCMKIERKLRQASHTTIFSRCVR